MFVHTDFILRNGIAKCLRSTRLMDRIAANSKHLYVRDDALREIYDLHLKHSDKAGRKQKAKYLATIAEKMAKALKSDNKPQCKSEYLRELMGFYIVHHGGNDNDDDDEMEEEEENNVAEEDGVAMGPPLGNAILDAVVAAEKEDDTGIIVIE